MARKPGTRARNYSLEPSNNQFGPKATDPHSPWQLLIEGIREEKELTIRQVAAKAQIPSGTLFNWIRSRKGCPSRSAYTSMINKRLAAAIGVPEEQLADAYNRSAFTPINPSNPDPAPPRPAPGLAENPSALEGAAGMTRFMDTLRVSGRNSFTLAELEMISSLVTRPDRQAT